ncbi:glycosyltransferase involved in cell wall biosynthesis [Priestia megaterium]|uniref:glycosyltransferase family 2 protein n=1 Tax=Priestia megaterium TaxID=1404 RepID=UPI000471B5E9|nr:glycosyltransferase family 2 protein [Priestia megaterium]TCN16119.1 glycosyltransferase involved in cell wall biosynthesis [Bacillus sp. BK006]MCM3017019.1 glycosyltransferase family 2 protein [Priestia megaterium]MCM3192704.1 glycosyltransferase family 2 protein [Priestia megaterium]MED3916805.1 glycosyltransferase family 2 protein [Priestia megaterium]PFA97285.1 glycosyltransferase [Priestia megaterium]
MNRPILTIVVPCYNEEEVFTETSFQLTAVIKELINERLVSSESTILFVDDGSKDSTWSLIEKESCSNLFVKGLKLARNVGHQNALLAGLEAAHKQSDCVISIDADLQDDISVIRTFIEKYWLGYEVVYGVRDSRETDTFFKRTTAVGFYRFMNKLGIQLVQNHADFRLMSKRALGELMKYKEGNVFLRGLVPLVGFRSTEVTYDRKERTAGESKYPLKKMLAFAFDGITSFSVAPIRLLTLLGGASFLFSIAFGIYALIQKYLDHTQIGWTSLILSIWLVGGLQLMGMGLVGEYIGKIFNEVKQRPKYAIERDLYTKRSLDKHKDLLMH